MAVPAATPAPVIARANAALNTVLRSPELAERVGRLGYTPRPTEPEWFREYLRRQIETLTRQAREATTRSLAGEGSGGVLSRWLVRIVSRAMQEAKKPAGGSG